MRTISSTLEPVDIALMSIFAVIVGLTMHTHGTHYGLVVDKIVANGRKVRADLPLVLLVLGQGMIFQPSLSWYMARIPGVGSGWTVHSMSCGPCWWRHSSRRRRKPFRAQRDDIGEHRARTEEQEEKRGCLSVEAARSIQPALPALRTDLFSSSMKGSDNFQSSRVITARGAIVKDDRIPLDPEGSFIIRKGHLNGKSGIPPVLHRFGEDAEVPSSDLGMHLRLANTDKKTGGLAAHHYRV